jgi:hypothetical protein
MFEMTSNVITSTIPFQEEVATEAAAPSLSANQYPFAVICMIASATTMILLVVGPKPCCFFE